MNLICWSWRLQGNYATKILDSLKNVTLFKMFNNHVFCQLSRTHLYFSVVRSHQKLKVKKFKIIEVEEKKNEKKWHSKTKI